jgi:prolyl-tRNA synthetase
MVRGDCQVNETKLLNHLKVSDLTLAEETTTVQATGAPVGFAGPINLKDEISIICDYSLKGSRDLVVGANEADYHYEGVQPERDFKVREYADVRSAREGDPCPKCGSALRIMRGIEVGHVFKLGDKYSRAMNATYLDEKGESRTIVMGCYGIGIGRTIAAAIEQNHDDFGIIWPFPIAPFHVIVIPVNLKDDSTRKAAEDLYSALHQASVEVLLDDRDERLGVKFKDADLIGVPIQVIIGPKGLAEGNVELKNRSEGSKELVPLDQAVETLRTKIEDAFARSEPE